MAGLITVRQPTVIAIWAERSFNFCIAPNCSWRVVFARNVWPLRYVF